MSVDEATVNLNLEDTASPRVPDDVSGFAKHSGACAVAWTDGKDVRGRRSFERLTDAIDFETDMMRKGFVCVIEIG